MSSMSATPIVIDAKGHLLGRLASVIAKQLLSGQKLTVVRCEEINVSGHIFRQKVSRCPRSGIGRMEREGDRGGVARNDGQLREGDRAGRREDDEELRRDAK